MGRPRVLLAEDHALLWKAETADPDVAVSGVVKLSASRDLVRAVHTALRDERYLPSDVAQAPTRSLPGHPPCGREGGGSERGSPEGPGS